MWDAIISVRLLCMQARTAARRFLTDVRAILRGSRSVVSYCSPSSRTLDVLDSDSGCGWATAGESIEVIFRILESVRTRLFSYGFFVAAGVLGGPPTPSEDGPGPALS